MGFELAQRVTAFAGEDRRWIASMRGVTDCEPVTLDGTLFSTTVYPDGRIPSGTALGRVTSGGLVGPYDPTASDGRQTCIGILLNTEGEGSDGAPLAARKISTAVFVRGSVFRNRLPVQGAGPGFIDSAAVTALPLIRFRNV